MAAQESPIVCTLTTKEAAAQTLEWQDLRSKIIDATAIAGGARMAFPVELVRQVEDLAQREATCCAFLRLTVERDATAETAVLEVTTDNPDGLPVISLLAGIPLP